MEHGVGWPGASRALRHGRRWLRGLLLPPCLAAGAALLAPAPAAQAACQLKQVEMRVRMVGLRPTATVTLNGVEVSMLVDSGAFFSVISPALAEQLQLRLRPLPPGLEVQGYTGRIAMMRTVVQKLGLLGAELPNIEFLVGGNELGQGIAGVLGRNLLAMGDTEYDLAHGAVRLSFPTGDSCKTTNFAHWAGQAPVIEAEIEGDMRGDPAITVQAAVNGTRVLALLDTGAARTSLKRRAASRAGITEAQLTPNGRAGGAGENRVTSWTAPVASFEMGGQSIANSRLAVDDTRRGEVDMLLGVDYFLAHRIYVSKLQGRLYATWNGTRVFPPASGAGGALDTRDAALPTDPSADDADALARRGAASLAGGRLAPALDDLDRAVALAPASAEHRETRARILLALRRPGPAAADLDEALRLNPGLPDARVRRAELRMLRNERPAALDDLRQLDDALPPTAPQRAAMAQLFATLGEVPQALRQFELWMAPRPDDMQMAAMQRARCWMRTQRSLDLPLALRDCRAAVARDPGDHDNQAVLGWTLLRMNEAAQALKAFEASIKLRSTAMALYGRGLAQLALGDGAAAERDLAAARQAAPRVDQQVLRAGFEPAPGAPSAPAAAAAPAAPAAPSAPAAPAAASAPPAR